MQQNFASHCAVFGRSRNVLVCFRSKGPNGGLIRPFTQAKLICAAYLKPYPCFDQFHVFGAGRFVVRVNHESHDVEH